MQQATVRLLPLLVVVGVAVSACGRAAAGGIPGTGEGSQVTQRIELSAARIAAGQSISGSLVIVNPGAPINLSHGCRPGYTVILTNSRFPPEVFWPTDCAAGPFVIPTGTTRLSVTVPTRYPACTQSGNGTHSMPPCLADEEMPPLPLGTYEAVAAWEGRVPLPPASAVTVTLVAAS